MDVSLRVFYSYRIRRKGDLREYELSCLWRDPVVSTTPGNQLLQTGNMCEDLFLVARNDLHAYNQYRAGPPS
jgi:hypothetical protein